MSGSFGQNADDRFVQRFIERAKYDLIYVAMRVLEITARYFQFRMREIVARGLAMPHNYNIRYEDNKVIMVLEVEVPRELVEKYARSYGEMAKIVRKIIRTARIVDRYKSRSRTFEDLEGVEFDVESIG